MDAIHVVGAGAVGCTVGHALARGGAPVVFVERSSVKIDQLRQKGVRAGGPRALPAASLSFDDWRPEPGAVVLLCTKSYDNAAVLERLPERVRLVPLQNGFDPILDAAFPDRVEGIVGFASECRPHRTHAHLTHRGPLYLGIHGQATSPLRDLATTLAGWLRQIRFPVTFTDDVRPFKHAKLATDAALCPLAGIGGLENAQVLWQPLARELFFDLLRENHAILKRAGVALGQVGLLGPATMAAALARPWLHRPLAWLLARSLRGASRSMADDLPGGRTEIDHVNGHLVRLAGESACPLNRVLLAFVGRMIGRHLPPSLDRLAELRVAFRAVSVATPAAAA